MAVRASVTITLSCYRDTEAVVRYYLLQSSTLDAPEAPSKYPPEGSWDDTEPGYEEGSTNSLYFVDCSVFSDGTWLYSSVSLSSSYEAAKEAYNKAVAAANAAAKKNTVYWQTAAPSEETFQTNDLWFDTGNGNTLYYWTGAAWQKAPFGAASIDVDELSALAATIGGLSIGQTAVYMVNKVVTADDTTDGTADDDSDVDDGGVHVDTDESEVYNSPAEDGTYNILSSDCTDENSAFLLVAVPSASEGSAAKAYILHDGRAKFASVLAGGEDGKNIIIGTTARTDDVSVRVRNQLRNGIFEVSAAGNLGIWDSTNGNWVIRSIAGQDVQIPHPLYVEGTQVPTIVSGVTASTTVSASSYVDLSVTFGHTFSAAPTVQITPIWGTTSTNAYHIQFTVASRSTTGCTIRILNGHTASFSPAVMWTAIGT